MSRLTTALKSGEIVKVETIIKYDDSLVSLEVIWFYIQNTIFWLLSLVNIVSIDRVDNKLRYNRNYINNYVNIKDSNGCSPLELACLITPGFKIPKYFNAIAQNSKSIINIEKVIFQRSDIITKLISKGAYFSEVHNCEIYRDLVKEFMFYDQISVIKIMKRRGAKIFLDYQDKLTLLQEAIVQGYGIATIQSILKIHAQEAINARNNIKSECENLQNGTALFYTVKCYEDTGDGLIIFKELLYNGADANEKTIVNGRSYTPLILAKEQNKEKFIEEYQKFIAAVDKIPQSKPRVINKNILLTFSEVCEFYEIDKDSKRLIRSATRSVSASVSKLSI